MLKLPRGLRPLCALAVALAVAGPARAGDETWVGKTILVKRNGIKFGCTDERGAQVYHGTLTRISYQVRDERDGWLCVMHDGVQGWFDKDEAVLLEDAVDYFTRVLEQNPTSTADRNRRAMAWQMRGELDLALKELDALLEQDPAEAAFWNNRGLLRAATGDPGGAVEDFGEAIRIDPRCGLYHRNRGDARLQRREYDQAVRDCTEALRLVPRDPDALLIRASARSGLRQYDGAIEDYTACLNVDDRRVNAWIGRAHCRRRQGAYEQALRDYGQALKTDPESARGYNDLAWLLATCPEARWRDGALAVEVAEQACERTGWREAAYVDTLAAAHAEAGDFAKAVHYQEQALADPAGAQRLGDGGRERLQRYQNKQPYRE